MQLDLTSSKFSKSKTYHQALLYAKVNQFLEELISKEKPEILEDFKNCVLSLKIQDKIQIGIFSSNSHFLNWLQTEVDLIEILTQDLKSQKLITPDQELQIKFRLG